MLLPANTIAFCGSGFNLTTAMMNILNLKLFSPYQCPRFIDAAKLLQGFKVSRGQGFKEKPLCVIPSCPSCLPERKKTVC
jgi:hypothetical protein